MCWVLSNRPELIDPKKYAVNVFMAERMYKAARVAIAERGDGSLCSPKIADYILAAASADDAALVAEFFRAYSISKTAAKKMADSLAGLAEWNQAQVALSARVGCVDSSGKKRASASRRKSINSQKTTKANGDAVGPCDSSEALLNELYRVAKLVNAGEEESERAKAIVREKIKTAEVSFPSNPHGFDGFNSRIGIVLQAFESDCDFLDELGAAGLTFTSEDVQRVDGDGDAWTVRKLLEGGHVDGARYALSHGAKISKPDQLLYRWRNNPAELADLLPSIAVGSIAGASDLLTIVAGAGDVSALKALELWDEAYNEFSIDTAIAAASESGCEEAFNYLTAKKTEGCSQTSSIGAPRDSKEGAPSPELRAAIGLGAVTSDLVLVDANLIPGGPCAIPCGIRSYDGKMRYPLDREVVLQDGVDFPLTIEVDRMGNTGFCRHARSLSLPVCYADTFEELFVKNDNKELCVRDEGEALRVMVRLYSKPDDGLGDSRAVVDKANAAAKGAKKPFEERYEKYATQLDKMLVKGGIKHIRNTSRLAVARLADQKDLTDKAKAKYLEFVKKNEMKFRKSFESNGEGVMLGVLEPVMASPEFSEN